MFQAIPDFGPGAMENWGLITYREPYLLYDPLKSSTSENYIEFLEFLRKVDDRREGAVQSAHNTLHTC